MDRGGRVGKRRGEGVLHKVGARGGRLRRVAKEVG